MSTRARRRRGSSSLDVAKAEARQLLNLTLPTVLVQLGATIPPAMTASYVGRHLGAVYLDGFTLASLTGNLLTLSLLQGLFSASDTLSPQAFGAGNFRQVGLLAMRGYVASLVLMFPINVVLVGYMQPMLEWVGEDPLTSKLAAQWYRIYVWALPFYALYNVIWKFLSAQEIMTPLLVAMVATLGVILPISLEVLVRSLGFLGSAVAIVLYQISQALLLLLYLRVKQPHNLQTWPGLRYWKEALEWRPCTRYLKFGAGGMIAASEWWYWEVLCLLVGTLGVVPLSVHTVPTQVLTVSFMIPLGIGIALSIRLGATLPHSVKRAQHLAIGCAAASTVLFAIMAIAMYAFRNAIFRLFTTEPDVLEGCERIWWKVSVYFFLLAIFGINMGIANGLGKQWTLGMVTFIFLWVFGLPAVYYYALLRKGGIDAAWTWVYPPYIFMNLVLMVAFWVTDWHGISTAIRKREGLAVVVEEGDIEEVLVTHETSKYGSTEQRDPILPGEEKKSEPYCRRST